MTGVQNARGLPCSRRAHAPALERIVRSPKVGHAVLKHISIQTALMYRQVCEFGILWGTLKGPSPGRASERFA